jgi:hypothetical protein
MLEKRDKLDEACGASRTPGAKGTAGAGAGGCLEEQKTPPVWHLLRNWSRVLASIPLNFTIAAGNSNNACALPQKKAF